MKLKDIAREAGVAISTVSRVLKDPDSSAASPEMKEKIFQIALKGGYINEIPGPDSFDDAPHSTLPTKVLYCMLAVDPKESEDSPFFNRLMESIRSAAHHYNYITEYYFPTGDDKNGLSIPMDMGKTVRGIIVIGRSLPNFIDELTGRFDNILYIGLTSLETDCDQIVCSGFDAAKAVVHLYNKNGHEKIGFIGPADDDRMRGYMQAMTEVGLSVEAPTMIAQTDMSYNGGYTGMNQLLDNRDIFHPVTAVFCANDNSAIGALQACRERGIRVPEDVNIIGMDGSEMAKYLTPSLSTVHVPLEEMGKFAVRVLRDRMHGGHARPIKVFFPFNIIERASGPSKR